MPPVIYLKLPVPPVIVLKIPAFPLIKVLQFIPEVPFTVTEEKNPLPQLKLDTSNMLLLFKFKFLVILAAPKTTRVVGITL